MPQRPTLHCAAWALIRVTLLYTTNSFGRQGSLVHLVVHGQRHNYDTVRKLPELERLGPDEDWRKVFLDAAPGRIISWRGTLYMKADATVLKGFLSIGSASRTCQRNAVGATVTMSLPMSQRGGTGTGKAATGAAVATLDKHLKWLDQLPGTPSVSVSGGWISCQAPRF